MAVENEVLDGQLVKSNNDTATLMRKDQSVEMALANAEKHINKRRGLVKLIAKNIDPRDVVIYGKPPKETVHYAKNACKQILSWIDADIVDVSISQTEYQRKTGPYLIFEATGLLILPGGRRISITGSRATYDDFFGRAYSNDLPIEEVDIPSVRLAAITNMWNHALEDAGLKPSLEELREAGLNLEKASYVEFKERKSESATEQSGDAKDANRSEKTSSASGDVISEAQGKRLFAIARNLGWNSKDYQAALYSEFNVQSDRELPKAVYQKAEKFFTDNRKN